jgi:two-component system response regulator PilR (NtrC family)
MNPEPDRDFRVLLCEDDPGVRRLITVILERAQILVQTAPDGEAAISEITSCEPDLILLDLTMPRFSGLEVIAWLKANRPELLSRIIVITAAANATITNLESEPICNIIRKPFDIEELRQVVFACRDRSRPDRAA